MAHCQSWLATTVTYCLGSAFMHWVAFLTTSSRVIGWLFIVTTRLTSQAAITALVSGLRSQRSDI